MIKFLKRQPPVRLIAAGFFLVILLGSFLLTLPVSLNDGAEIRYIDALYTSVSAVCVTGLSTIEAGAIFSLFGRTVLCLLIQVGGLGVATVGAGFIMLMGKKMDLKSRNLIHEAMNLDSGKGALRFLREVFFTTLVIEGIGAALSFIVFVQEFKWYEALGYSLFHAVSAFNNAGFDIFGRGNNLIPYQGNVFFNIVTSALIIFGGIGFLVIREMRTKGFCLKKYSMHSKVVLLMTSVLLVSGTILIKMTEGENITWLGAFFASVTARTAGFSTFSFGNFTSAGLFVMMVLMFIGASSGSTGGGIKTTTVFVIIKTISTAVKNGDAQAFKYTIPRQAYKKASVIVFIGVSIISISTLLLCIFEPTVDFVDILFEMVSASATVGLSTGITPELSTASKIVSMVVMYIGRLGPLTVVSIWNFQRNSRVRYPFGNIAIG
jgi:trk system potassium uptake protein TrkH